MSILKFENIKIAEVDCENSEKNSKFIEELLIQYNDINFINEMKKGYREMGEINLEYSKLGCEYMLEDVNEYEAWICGV